MEKGGKVTEPAEPSYDKHEFIGWYKESACTNEWKFAEDTGNPDITLYAKWEKVMKGGRLLALGTADELKRQTGKEKFEEAFIAIVKEN